MVEKYKADRCKICQSDGDIRDRVDKYFDEGMKSVDIQKIFPQFNGTNLSRHKRKHANMNTYERLQQIRDAALRKDVGEDISISDLLKLMDYTEKYKSEDYNKELSRWQVEFQARYSALEGLLLNTDSKLPILNDIDQESRKMLLRVVKMIMTDPMIEGELDIGNLIQSILGTVLKPSTRVWEDTNNDST